MLSRTADSIYWLARYVERAEYLARILEATQRLTALPLAYSGSTNEWESAVATAGCSSSFYKTYADANEETVADFLAFAAVNPLAFSLGSAARAPANSTLSRRSVSASARLISSPRSLTACPSFAAEPSPLPFSANS